MEYMLSRIFGIILLFCISMDSAHSSGNISIYSDFSNVTQDSVPSDSTAIKLFRDSSRIHSDRITTDSSLGPKIVHDSSTLDQVLDTESISGELSNSKKEQIETEEEKLIGNKSNFKNLIAPTVKLIKKVLRAMLIILLILVLLYLGYILIRKVRLGFTKLNLLSERVKALEKQVSKLNSKIEVISNEKIPSKKLKPPKDFNKIEKAVKKNISDENKLTESELKLLLKSGSNNWLTISHSEVGISHLKHNPVIPCQDSHYVTSLGDWELAIVCDGAGSAKLSHIGSNLMATEILPEILEKKIQGNSWYLKNIVPSDKQWNTFATSLLNESYERFKDVIRSRFDGQDEKEFACTVILTLYNKDAALVLNIGDGRGGYLNNTGQFKPLFKPYRGTESNATVFITSPIFENTEQYIQTNIIQEHLISVFLLSDGMEKVSFNCSIMEKGLWFDPNIPHKNFFYPVLLKISETPTGKEDELQQMWENFIRSGSEEIKNEADDKTMVISYLR